MTATLAAALAKPFRGGTWTDGEIQSAVAAAMEAECLALAWRWSVGTPGSIHYCSGWAPTREQAEEQQGASHDATLSRHRAIGALDGGVERETNAQRMGRLSQAVERRLNEG